MMWLCAAEDGDDTRQSGFHAGTHVQGCDCQPDGIDADHRSHPCNQGKRRIEAVCTRDE